MSATVIGDATIHHGDVRAVLAALPAESVQTVVTSPPYWGLRDYGVEGQIGLERTPAEYVETIVRVFRGVRRVLRDDGTLWLNLGDSYAASGRGGGGGSFQDDDIGTKVSDANSRRAAAEGFKPKDMVGIPWRVALALQADGWYLRSDIIWAKPNPMPESVTDRPTKSHEYLFLFAKSERYYYDAEAIKEPVTGGAHARGDGLNPKAMLNGDHPRNVDCRYQAPGQPEHTGLRKNGIRAKQNSSFSAAISRSGNKERKAASARGVPVDDGGLTVGAVAGSIPWEGSTRNKRTVWTVATQPFSEAHFATFPPKLIEPCILAGAPPNGVVLDPFHGAGTTGMVALQHGRRYIGIELNADYIAMSIPRIEAVSRQARLFA